MFEIALIAVVLCGGLGFLIKGLWRIFIFLILASLAWHTFEPTTTVEPTQHIERIKLNHHNQPGRSLIG